MELEYIEISNNFRKPKDLFNLKFLIKQFTINKKVFMISYIMKLWFDIIQDMRYIKKADSLEFHQLYETFKPTML